MIHALTRTRQRNAVSEGFAFGLLQCGYSSIDFPQIHMTSVNTRLEDAWYEWAHRETFPQVSTDLRNGSNAELVFTEADSRKGTWCYYWEDFQVFERPQIEGRQDVTLEEVADMIDGDLSAKAWKQLAIIFLKHLDLPIQD